MVEKKSKSLKYVSISNAILIIGIVVVVNILSSLQYFRFDLTSDKVHTLSENSKKVVDSIQDIINVEIYLEDDNLSPELLKLQKAVDEKFQDFKEESNGKIKFKFINPNADDIEKDKFQKNLKESGLEDIVVNITEENSVSAINIWPCAKVYFSDRAANIQFLDRGKPITEGYINLAINELEYAITKALFDVMNTTRKRIVFIEGHGELSEAETWIINKELNELYYTERKQIDGKLDALFGFDMAIVAKPQLAFSDKDAYILDQFIMNGGKVVWLIDPLDVQQDSLKKTGQTMALTRNLNIESQLFKYGVRINNNLVLDKQCGPINIPGYSKLYRWYFHPMVGLTTNPHPITKNVNPVKLQYASSIDTVGSAEIKKSVILETSDFSMQYKAPARINYNIVRIDPNFSATNNRPHMPLAVLLEGNFKSYFTNYINPEYKNNPVAKFKEESGDNKMIIIGDGDIIRNEIYQDNQGREMYINLEYEPLLSNMQYAQKIYGNNTFFLNAVDYLLGQDNLVNLRARETVFRPLDENKIKDGRKSFWQFINILLPLLILIILGLLQFFIRRAKYSK